MITPFDADGTVDHDALARIIHFLIDQGIDFLVALGTTGESVTLTHEEKKAVFDTFVRENNQRVPLIMGVGGNCTRSLIESFQSLDPNGFDAILSVTPYYNRPSQEGLYQHFTSVAKETDLPIILYNVPSRTSIDMASGTVARLSKVKNIVGIKEASGSLVKVSEIIASCGPDFAVIFGEDALTWPILAVGGKGVISVTANLVPDKFSELCKAAKEGDIETAKALHYELLSLNDVMFIETNPIPVKAALALMGRIENEFRPPLCPPAKENLAQLETILKLYSLV